VEDVTVEGSDSRIDKVAVRKALGERLIGSRFLYFLTLTSTNDHARELAEDGWPEGTVVLSEEQTAGKGRSGRIWHSPSGVGIYVSVLLKPSMPHDRVQLLTLMAAVAATRGLRDAGHESLIKWPNDLIFGSRKIGGILADARLRPGSPAEIVLGIGLNINNRKEDFPEDLHSSAGSIQLTTGVPADRTRILTSILLRLDEEYTAIRGGSEAALIGAFMGLCPMALGAKVTVHADGEPYTGETAGLTSGGALRVATATGMRELRAGEVSVREG